MASTNMAQVLIITIILRTNTLIRRIVRNNLDALGTLCQEHITNIYSSFITDVLNVTENVLTLTNYLGTVPYLAFQS